MNIEITAIPTDGIQIDMIDSINCKVSLYKNESTTTDTNGISHITADMVCGNLRYSTELASDIKSNFDWYWNKFYNVEYQNNLDAINATYVKEKKSIHERHSAILLSSALTDDQKVTAIANLKTEYATLTTNLLSEQEAL